MAFPFQKLAITLFTAVMLNAGFADAAVETATFGQLPEGKAAKLYTLRNAKGMVVKVTDYGGIITEISTPGRDGKVGRVLLGASTLEEYVKGYPAAAATIGRYANRIKDARFQLEGKEVKVTANAGKNHIHGGKTGFSKVLWTGRVLPEAAGKSTVELTYRAADGEEGFPGNCNVTVTFTLTDANELVIEYKATTDKATVINLTNHAYFNLAGGGDVLAHQMQLFADQYTLVDAALIPTGEIAAVAGTPLDFRTPHTIGERITQVYEAAKGYDHNYIVNGKAGTLRKAARVSDPKSGRVMECWTTQPGVQLYTANHFSGKADGAGNVLPRHGGFCLETQHYPDSPNQPKFPSTTLTPGKEFKETTKFVFSVE
jgi:aldose 1-epimerase